jgi:23S rRNA (uracil1939-C5)-methyltransferase
MPMPVDGIELEITDLSRDGLGVGRIDGEVVFVPGALPGERVLVRLQPRRRRRLAELVRLEHRSQQRRRPPCILAEDCGGCSLQALADEAQRAWKGRTVAETLRRIGGLEVPETPPPAPGACLGYRNRAVIPLERRADGLLRAGYYRRGSHRIVNMNRCPVLDPRLDRLIAPLKADLEASGWPVDHHRGILRHLALRLGHHSGEILITLIATEANLEGLEPLAEHWLARWPEVVGVGLNLQPHPDNRLFGPETITLAGRGWLEERFADVRLQVGAETFFQINTPEAERVAARIIAALEGEPRQLIDAYCGIGTFSLPLAAQGWRVLGIERLPAAVDLARSNAAWNGLGERARFEVGGVAEALAGHLGEPGAPTSALLLDPPRKGLDPESLAAIAAAPPGQLLYLSCDPSTLARDLERLCGSGPYRVVSLETFDFFPQTTHIETLAVLHRDDG